MKNMLYMYFYNGSIALQLYVSIDILMLSSALYLIYKFITDFIGSRELEKLLFYLGLTHFIISILYLIFAGMHHIYWALNNETYMPIWLAYSLLFALQFYCMCCYLLIRLHTVFNETAYKLSKITQLIYKLLIIVSPFIFITVLIVLNIKDTKLSLFLVQAILLSYGICVSLSISSLFIYKLIYVHKRVEDNSNDPLINVITKNTILVIISFTLTILVIVLFLIVSAQFDTVDHVDNLLWFLAYALLFDGYTNLICISLSFSCFDNVYIKTCGCCDRKCRQGLQNNSIIRKSLSRHTQLQVDYRTNDMIPSQDMHYVKLVDNE
eukprot:165872_1